MEQKVVIQVPLRHAKGLKGHAQYYLFLVTRGKDISQWHEEATGIICSIKTPRSLANYRYSM